MAEASDPALATAFALATVQGRILNAEGITTEPVDGGMTTTSSPGTLAAAFNSFLNNPDQFDSSNLPAAMISNILLAGQLGLLPQQGATAAAPADHAPVAVKAEPTNAGDAATTSAVASVDSTYQLPPMPELFQRPGMTQHQPRPAAAAPEAWPPSGAPAPGQWDYGMVPQQQPLQRQADSQPQQGVHGGAAPASSGMPGQASLGSQGISPTGGSADLSSGAGTAAAAAAVGAPAPQGSTVSQSSQPPLLQPQTSGGPMPVPHAGPMRYPPYGAYHYPHPGMPGAPGPPGHGHMMPPPPPYGHHPGYPPPPPHLRGGYYPPEARYPPMGPPPPMGHPHYPYGYRPHPGMPPHPAYHYMPPPPYGHPHHPAMHPGAMYPGMQPPPPVAPGAPPPPPQQQPANAATASVDGGAASGASEDAAAMRGGASDGGTDPASAASQPSQALLVVPAPVAGPDGPAPAAAAGKLAGNSSIGGESVGDVGLEAVITLRQGVCDDSAQQQQQQLVEHPGALQQQQQQAEEELEAKAEATAPSSDDVMAPGPAPSAAPAGTEADGGVPKAPPQQAGAVMPPPQWPHMAPPPPHMMGVPPGYEWPAPPPHHHHPHMHHPHHPGMMPPPGYAPAGVPPPPPPHAMPPPPPPHAMHPSNSWGYPYDPYAVAAMHHQHAMMGGNGNELGEDPNAAAAAGADYAAQQQAAAAAQLAARRRPSQNGLPPPGPSATPVGAGPQQRRSSSTFPSKGYPGTSMGSGSGAMAMGLGMDSVLKAAAGEQQRPGSAELPGLGSTPSLQMTRSGSFSQLNQWFGLGDAQCNVSRRTQRLKKRRSTEHSGGGATPDPFLIGLAAERAASGREPSSGGSGMLPFGLPPMFPGSGGGAGVSGGGAAFSGGVPPRRSSGGSDRTALLQMGRSGSMPLCIPPNGRQRSDPGYLIEGGPLSGGYDQVAFMGLPGWPPGAGSSGGGAPPGMGPMAGLGQLMNHPGHPPQPHPGMMQHPHAHMPHGPHGVMPGMQPPHRPSENGSAGRGVNLPRRFDDAMMAMDYPKAHPGQHYGAVPVPQRGAYAHGYADEEEDGGADGAGGVGGKDPDDSDEDYDAAAEYGYRRVYNSYRRPDADGEGGASRKRKAPMAREDPPQPEKKRKARDPATISKVVLNCVIILRMVGSDVVYEKEIRTTLGNNPDTSKALRLMVNQGKLVRTGHGGRGNPFAYRCTPLGLSTLQKIEAAATPGAEPNANPNAEQRAAAVAVEQAPEPVAVVG
ncbi:hypothetical protein HYH02_006631 [Chlamydomonas schloesseri]|uniref:HTH three-helical bundle domain-containing protein n=1 Tax=Chlamydomonas schloesseri TaxID=2026947 RepID=A0A835W6M1_9CHLO|nr:hypothetical protein HYH02_006631 [Chlamydomonas schloesseri]|eukprot:KAG2439109.1 hypothetical protein HYH02_006631 [Chlamydomonas schloesseri]